MDASSEELLENSSYQEDLQKQCQLFPSYATLAHGAWHVHVRGWTFSFYPNSRSRRLALGVARLVTGLDHEDEAYHCLKQRSRMFFSSAVPDEPITIQVIGVTTPEKFELEGDPTTYLTKMLDEAEPNTSEEVLSQIPRPSTPEPTEELEIPADEGVIECDLSVDADLVEQWCADIGHPKRALLRLRAFFAQQPALPAYGVVNLMPPQGVCVISDIDDTIKETGMLEGARTVMDNTFLRDMQEVPGMADLYFRWYRQGVDFHYVGNGPWELLPTLSQFFRQYHFPPGAAHMRMFKCVTSVIRDTLDQTKPNRIMKLLDDFPQRRFILIGDTAEKDPEAYGEVARQHPDRIIAIFIRDVTIPYIFRDLCKHDVACEYVSEHQSALKQHVEQLCQKFWFETKDEASVTVHLEEMINEMTERLAQECKEQIYQQEKALKELRQRIFSAFEGVDCWHMFSDAKDIEQYETVIHALSE